LAKAGFEIGFHTLRHDYLPALDDLALRVALTDGREALAYAVGTPLAVLSYPHGGVDDRVMNAAREAGYVLGFTVEPTPVTVSCDPLSLGRVTPSVLSTGHMAARLGATLMAGLWRQRPEGIRVWRKRASGSR
jgi:peptidoglycan/xylan/chitin deacetylase (PgdA/CDA1 family)